MAEDRGKRGRTRITGKGRTRKSVLKRMHIWVGRRLPAARAAIGMAVGLGNFAIDFAQRDREVFEDIERRRLIDLKRLAEDRQHALVENIGVFGGVVHGGLGFNMICLVILKVCVVGGKVGKGVGAVALWCLPLIPTEIRKREFGGCAPPSPRWGEELAGGHPFFLAPSGRGWIA